MCKTFLLHLGLTQRPALGSACTSALQAPLQGLNSSRPTTDKKVACPFVCSLPCLSFLVSIPLDSSLLLPSTLPSWPKPPSQLDANTMLQLQAEGRALLDTIDELRILGLGQFVDLSQIIVVGDQSAEKSSVLEAISRVRFPIKDGDCTRCATELVLRKTRDTKIQVKIQGERVDDFVITAFSKDDLPGIVVGGAKQRLGVGDGDGDGDDSSTFTEEVLRVEISGPVVPQLTLVDLPGLCDNETESQDAGLNIANRLAAKYMRQENSIILAVMSAQNELAAQNVLEEAKKHDPERARTLGITTRPDRVDELSHKQAYLRLAQNEESAHRLALGWHLLRNRSQKEAHTTDAERDETHFFQSGIWSVMKSQDRGIESLRGKLSDVLLSHIKHKLPSLVTEIEQLISQRQARLKDLGDHRSSPQEMRTYLTQVSSHFRDLARDAVRGNYLDEFFRGLDPDRSVLSYEDRRVRKLRAFIRDLNRAFYFVLYEKGHRRNIYWGSRAQDEGDRDEDEQEMGPPGHLGPLLELYDFADPTTVTLPALKSELDTMASENQGTEFPGSPSDRLTLRLFRDQSQPWERISNRHVELVASFAKSFVEKLIFHVVGRDTKTADPLLRAYVDPYFQDKKTVLRAKLEELLHHYKYGYDPQSLFIRLVLNSLTGAGLVPQASERLEEAYPNLSAEGLAHVVLSRIVLDSAEEDSTGESDTDKIIESMVAYYEVREPQRCPTTTEPLINHATQVSLRIFTDVIMVLAVEDCLISDLPTILDPDKVSSMTDEEVQMLAAESPQVRRDRDELQAQLSKLQRGLAAVREVQPREFIGTLPVPKHCPNDP